MAFHKSGSAIGCGLLLSLWVFPVLGQSVSGVAPPDSTTTRVLSGQVFHCHTGYPLAQCQADIFKLKSILAHYPIESLGPWTWVLVRSQDWQPISRVLQLSPDTPAFTALEPRETFLEEALFVHDAERTAELMEEWHCSIPELLKLAVSHELAHALCEQTSEAIANRIGEELRNGLSPSCQLSRRGTKKIVVAGEDHRAKPDAFRAP